MRKFKVDTAITINPPQVVGLKPEQSGPRSHNLRAVDDVAPDGFRAFEVLRAIQFKIGEEICADELPKNLASLVIAEGEGDESGAADSPDFAAMSVAQLKEFLSANAVEIPKGAKKPELIALAATVETSDDSDEGDQDEDDSEGEGDESDEGFDDDQDDDQ